ncbi:Cobyric acid synthase [Vibrio stylophorae]|uniref:Cobyric acid synthase n=1 Tax=Vibrio stylophorae TaxID=659351 RepID=A0ABN8DTP6_9VIBR|nr:cobyric acid synthase [Vibrio stylophorae]CAH0533703.1 Cobyric acid synthase [Vibrio stylophorae]
MLSTLQALMVQGTTSDAGKSVLVAGLCRVLARRGVQVAPFKPQNMALNSAVTEDGGEIGRAQAVQAYACGVAPSVHMNPILLKPSTDMGAQVIVQGKALTNMQAQAYHDYKKVAMDAVMDSFGKLRQQFQSVMIEGAGSPAEINLREGDIANMGFAENADVPVIIVADIDRGGVFAHLVGTLDLLSPTEQARVVGFVINRFRGDIKLLESGLDWLEARTGKPVLGVLPYIHGLMLEAEDAINPEQQHQEGALRVVVPVFTRISNHTDFDPLRVDDSVELIFIGKDTPLPPCDLIILPGSKNVQADLAYLREQGWDQQIAKHLRYGGKVMGICGGYQMLGEWLHDPQAIEGDTGSCQGLGYLATETTLAEEKQLKQVQGTLQLNGNTVPVSGYEIHAGVTTRVNGEQAPQPWPIHLANGTLDGMVSEDQQVFGTYLHGIFESPQAYQEILAWAGHKGGGAPDFAAVREKGINQIADAIEAHMQLDELWPALFGRDVHRAKD